MGFKENLKSELAYQNMMVKELSEVTGISRHTLDNYLNVRERIPTADSAVKIARALGVSVEYLVTGEDQQVPPEIRKITRNLRKIEVRDRYVIADLLDSMIERRGHY